MGIIQPDKVNLVAIVIAIKRKLIAGAVTLGIA